MIGRRVIDRTNGDAGSVVAGTEFGTRYVVHWDNPTPNQDQVWVDIPSRFFRWADEHTEEPSDA